MGAISRNVNPPPPPPKTILYGGILETAGN